MNYAPGMVLVSDVRKDIFSPNSYQYLGEISPETPVAFLEAVVPVGLGVQGCIKVILGSRRVVVVKGRYLIEYKP